MQLNPGLHGSGRDVHSLISGEENELDEWEKLFNLSGLFSSSWHFFSFGSIYKDKADEGLLWQHFQIQYASMRSFKRTVTFQLHSQQDLRKTTCGQYTPLGLA